MKTSICTTGFKSDDIEVLLELFRDYPYNGLELWSGHIDRFLEKRSLNDLLSLINKCNLQIPCISGYFDFLSHDISFTFSVDELKKCLSYANFLNCKIIRTFIGNVPSEHMKDTDWEKCIKAIELVSDIARASDITIAFETHGGMPTDNADSCLRLINEIKDCRTGVIFDGFNLHLRGLNVIDEFHKLKQHIFHVHMKNCVFREDGLRVPSPMQKGIFDSLAVLDLLEDIRYEGYISVEYFGHDNLKNLEESLVFLNKERNTL